VKIKYAEIQHAKMLFTVKAKNSQLKASQSQRNMTRKFNNNKFSFKMREKGYLKAKQVQNFTDMLCCMTTMSCLN